MITLTEARDSVWAFEERVSNSSTVNKSTVYYGAKILSDALLYLYPNEYGRPEPNPYEHATARHSYGPIARALLIVEQIDAFLEEFPDVRRDLLLKVVDIWRTVRDDLRIILYEDLRRLS